MMDPFATPTAGIAETVEAIRAGRRSCAEVLDACLRRIDEREGEIRAWVVVDREGAREAARRLDDEAKAGRLRGPLHGIPVGIKDIIDVAGLPTAFGVPGEPGRVAEADAPVVASLRGRGAVILGKTASTPFAFLDPPPTRNPWAIDRTPGGSSSGSAAAVACGMCLGALGSQTGGSITRPSSYCGVAGFKPTYGAWPVDGILPLAPSLDHPGPIARTVADLAAMAGIRPEPPGLPPRIGRLGGLFDELAEASMREAMSDALRGLGRSGGEIVEVPLPDGFAGFAPAHRTILASEAAAFHERHRAERPGRYPPRISSLIDDGLALDAVGYVRAKEAREALRSAVLRLFDGVDVLATPAARGPAPGLETTGDPVFNTAWSLVGVPTITFPIAWSLEGLPLGIQLAGRPGPEGEAALFEAAAWAESRIRWATEPPPAGTTGARSGIDDSRRSS